MTPSFNATFRFGWGHVEAASARAEVTTNRGITRVLVEGGTIGAARALWRIDVTHKARFTVNGLEPLGFEQDELYGRRKVMTRAEFRADGLWRIRKHDPQSTPAKWKRIGIEPVRDIVSAMFFVRSQPLHTGDRVALVAFPGDAPFLAEVRVLSHESIQIAGTPIPAIKMEIRLHRFLMEKGQPPVLVKHGKFRKGTVWLSDDANRLPLRAEVDIFIGSVFAELESCSLPGY